MIKCYNNYTHDNQFQNPSPSAAYLKAAEGLEGSSSAAVQGVELWALAVGGAAALLLILALVLLLCFAHRLTIKNHVTNTHIQI